MTRRFPHLPAVAVAVGLVLLAGACGDDEPDASGSGDATTTTVADDGDAPTTSGKAVDGLTVTNSDFGSIIADVKTGLTVYLFTPDSATESTCVDSCANAWPPIAGPVDVGEGLDAAKVGTVERPDGTTQATYNGHPLYLYAGDSEPGDTLGQGSGGNWFVVGVNGEAITDDGADSRDGY